LEQHLLTGAGWKLLRALVAPGGRTPLPQPLDPRAAMIGRWLFAALCLILPGTAKAVGQERVVTNPIGMELGRSGPGSIGVARFQPTCAEPAPQADADPRTAWTEEDYRRCREIVARQSSPGFTVVIEEPFYIGRYEVTQEQWQRVMGSNPSFFQ